MRVDLWMKRVHIPLRARKGFKTMLFLRKTVLGGGKNSDIDEMHHCSLL